MNLGAQAEISLRLEERADSFAARLNARQIGKRAPPLISGANAQKPKMFWFVRERHSRGVEIDRFV